MNIAFVQNRLRGMKKWRWSKNRAFQTLTKEFPGETETLRSLIDIVFGKKVRVKHPKDEHRGPIQDAFDPRLREFHIRSALQKMAQAHETPEFIETIS